MKKERERKRKIQTDIMKKKKYPSTSGIKYVAHYIL